MGPQIVDLLMENGLINSFDDIFKLRKEDLLNLPRFAEKSVDNLIEVSKSKKNYCGKIFDIAINRFYRGGNSECSRTRVW